MRAVFERFARSAALITLSALVTLVAPSPGHAVPIAFQVDGQALNTALGYTVGDAVSFTFVLDDQRPLNVTVSPNPPYVQSACCGGQFAWRQNLSSQSHLWSGVSGTGLSGQWNPTANPLQRTTSGLSLWLGKSPSQTIDLQAFDNAGTNAATGVTVQGLMVTGFQVQASFLGLSALAAFGDSLFSSPVPHPNDLFAGLYGTYAADSIFSNQGTLNALASPTFRFKPLSLTISPVPEASSLAMALVGALVVLGFGGRSGRGRRGVAPLG
jgi:hypothetical protein